MTGASETFVAQPRSLDPREWDEARWSVYLMGFDLAHRDQRPALKIGMVGTGTIGARLRSHRSQFGPAEVLSAWTLAHATDRLDDLASWRLTEQYEARLQFAAEFADPTARTRRLRPDTLVYSYEWFEDVPAVVGAITAWALQPIALPSGWEFARDDPSIPSVTAQPRD